MPTKEDGVMIILSSPSGAGKTTLVNLLSKLDIKFKEAIISKIPSARLGEPDDIANAVLFLCSDESNYINGETLHVNGGMYMAWQNK